MQFKHLKSIVISYLLFITVTSINSYAGNIEPPGAPSASMKTLYDIYKKITTGSNAQTHSLFPTGSPGATMYTLEEIYNAIPAGSTTTLLSDIQSGRTVIIRNNGSMMIITGTGLTNSHDSGTITNDASVENVLTNYEFWGADGSRYSGRYFPTSANNVRNGITFGSNNSLTGNMVIPLENEVRNSVKYGANGTEYTGTFSSGTAEALYLLRTGQTAVYTNGDDGTYRNGHTGGYTNTDGSWNGNTRFSTNTAGDVVTDNLTGMMWIRDANLYGTGNWYFAVTNAKNCTAGGYNDWHLPSTREIQTIIDFKNTGPPFPTGHSFKNVQISAYWLSTTSALNPTINAWAINTYYGYMYEVNKSVSIYIWYCRTP